MDKDRHLCITSLLDYNMSWNEDVAYAMTPFKLLTAPVGGWPLQEYNKFALARYIISVCSMVRFQFLSYTHKRFYFVCVFEMLKIMGLNLIF